MNQALIFIIINRIIIIIIIAIIAAIVHYCYSSRSLIPINPQSF